MAEYVMKNLVKKAGLEDRFQIASEANSDYEEYDLLIGMDRANLRSMYRICGGDFNDKMHLLMEYAGRLEQEVADPWYTEDFDATWRDVLAGCQGLLDQIIAQGV